MTTPRTNQERAASTAATTSSTAAPSRVASNSASSSASTPLKWRAIASLIIIYVATVMGWSWVWGLMLLGWMVFDLRSGQAWLSETVLREDNPILFYLIEITWFIFAVYFIATPFLPAEYRVM